MQKKFVQRSLALSAAAALGLGSAFIAGPAAAAQKPVLDVQGDSALQKVVGEKLSDQSGELKSEIGRFGVKGNTLHIGVAKETSDIEKLDKKYSNVDVTVDPRYVRAEPQSKKDLVGGAGYLMTVPSDPKKIGACSTGFAGWDSSGKQVVLTAGHCAEDATNGALDSIVDMEKPSSANAVGGDGFVKAGTGAPGTWGFHQFGSDIVNGNQVKDIDKAIDLAVINVANGYTNKAEVTNWKSAGSDDLSKQTKKMTKVGSPVVGKTVQKSGRTTGVTKGKVMTGIDDEMPYANIGGRAVHGFEVDPSSGKFSDHGDSGGAVYQGSTAVGVISGGPDSGPSWTWVADLTTGLDKADQSFTFEDPNKTPEAPAAPTVSDQTIEPKGAITGKSVAGADVKVSWTGVKNGEATVKADDSGNFSVAGPEAEGAYDAKAVATVDGQKSKAASFKVTVKAADDADAKADSNATADAAADAKDATADAAADAKDANADAAADAKDANADSDGAADGSEKPDAPVVKDQKVDEGGQITGKAEAGASVKLSWNAAADTNVAAQAAVPAEGTATVTADSKGNFATKAPSDAGKYAYTAVATANGQSSAATKFNVTVEAAADAPAERAINISPKEIVASDFVKKDKAVTITVKGFDEGENVTLKIASGPKNVEGITLEQTANKDGIAAFSIYGTSTSNPEAYLGNYDVSVTGANDTDDEKALTGSFKVVADENGNGGGNDGGDNGDGGDGGSDLPRTGAELTGLAAGAGLLVIGGAAVVLTMRRKKN